MGGTSDGRPRGQVGLETGLPSCCRPRRFHRRQVVDRPSAVGGLARAPGSPPPAQPDPRARDGRRDSPTSTSSAAASRSASRPPAPRSPCRRVASSRPARTFPAASSTRCGATPPGLGGRTAPFAAGVPARRSDDGMLRRRARREHARIRNPGPSRDGEQSRARGESGPQPVSASSRASPSRWPAAPGRRTTRSRSLENWFVASGRFRYSNHPPVIEPRARRLRHPDARGLLPVLRRRDGAHAALPRDSRAGRRRLRRRDIQREPPTPGSSPTATPMPGSRSGSRDTAGCPFDPTPPAPGSRGVRRLAGTSARPAAGGRPGTTSRGAAGAGRGIGAIAQKLSRENGHRRAALREPRAHAPAVTAASGGGYRSRGRYCFSCSPSPSPGRDRAGENRLPADAGACGAIRVACAAACRAELASFLVDQRIEVPRSATLRRARRARAARVRRWSPGRSSAAATAARFGRAGARAGSRVHGAPRAARAPRGRCAAASPDGTGCAASSRSARSRVPPGG